ncbi:uncharacterized protein LOC114187482 isoform X2 [Vigna unguiculata]|uniref:uncharacterized protein LOC114187482 isoform X2 n=1 Tax=Vigna unguiculata TaxID=3917 RepID=UPI001016EA9F|nr:uncharacterized protein LOC114187482 isoform X2 [Vigna unguiculata]
MPSLQTALPPELANNALRLYRECLRRAKYIGHRKHNTELLVDMVRQQFKKHKHETDPEKIQKLKDEFVSGSAVLQGGLSITYCMSQSK